MALAARVSIALMAGALLVATPARSVVADGRKPLILLLHPYGMTGPWTIAYFRMGAIADRAVVLAPNGTRDVNGKSSWNASLACCNPTGPDDVAALSRMVEARVAQGDVDPSRVYVWGYSNGSFMAWRLACARADLFRAVVMLAGSVGAAADPPCVPSRPFDLLHVHGTGDATNRYRSGALVDGMPEPYLGVVSGSLQREAAALHCEGPALVAEYRAFDHDGAVPDRETDRYVTAGCDGRVEHWQLMGSGHIPALTDSWPLTLLAWSDARP